MRLIRNIKIQDWIQLILMAVLVIFTAANVFAQEEKKGPKIVKKDKFVHFLDENGSVVKEISLESKDIVTERYSKPYKRNRKLSKVYYKFAAINSNEKYVGLIESESGENVVLEPGEPTPEGYGEVGATSKFSLVDSSGKTLWKKDFPMGRFIADETSIKISDNGEKTVVLSASGAGGEGHLLYVYDNQGNELLRIGEDSSYHVDTDFKLSPNGKYLAVSVNNMAKKYPNNVSTIFYNLDRNAFWDSLEDHLVYKITNNGFVKVGSKSHAGREADIDLKPYIGE